MTAMETADATHSHEVHVNVVEVGSNGGLRNHQVGAFVAPGDHQRPTDAGGRCGGDACETEICDKGRVSSASECSVEVDLELGDYGVKAHSAKVKRDCRICQLSLDLTNQDSGFPIDLGCSCKDDLAAAHKQCAEAWFKIKGNKTCEICGSVASNVAGANEAELVEQWNEANDTNATAAAATQPAETHRFWQGHRFLNFLLGCMVFAFVISWLFHFNVPS